MRHITVSGMKQVVVAVVVLVCVVAMLQMNKTLAIDWLASELAYSLPCAASNGSSGDTSISVTLLAREFGEVRKDSLTELRGAILGNPGKSADILLAATNAHLRCRDPLRIAIVTQTTSRGTPIKSPSDCVVFRYLLPSLLLTTVPDACINYTTILGVDVGDPGLDEESILDGIHDVWEKTVAASRPSWGLSLEIVRLKGTSHAPSHAVDLLANHAIGRGADYVYQVNDDTILLTEGWAREFSNLLRRNPVYPNLGVTGPLDHRNNRILTHSFVHKTHLEIFGRYFPEVFRNWYSDNWITEVYSSFGSTFRKHGVEVMHAVHTNGERYTVYSAAKGSLADEVEKGKRRISDWLATKKSK